MIKVLLVDDEKNFVDGIALLLSDSGYETSVAYDGKQALEILDKSDIDVLVTDLIMPNMGGVELLERVRSLYPDVQSIVLTAHGGERENKTVRALGAKNFVIKPVDIDQLINMIDSLFENSQLKTERDELKLKLAQKETEHKISSIIGKSVATTKLISLITTVAATNLSILITGESGVGKQLVAESIHAMSDRKDKIFVDTHCASFSQTLLEDELFGHEKGAFTGASSKKKGIFERANGGTLFLDEIGEIPLSTQVKLLKVLEEKKFTPLGSDKEITSDFRLISATNRDLDEEVKNKNFREDLYYRINKMNIIVPPLRERKDDIVLLCASFAQKFADSYKKKFKGFSKSAIKALNNYPWPGNIRELENAIECAVVLSSTGEIELDNLPEKVIKYAK